jgi:hypothetical protein
MSYWNTSRGAVVDLTKGYGKSRQAPVGGRLISSVSLPAFNISNFVWMGASFITVEFIGAFSKSFAFQTPIIPPTGVNFCLCVRTVIYDSITGDPIVTRRKLWENVGEDLNYPLYTGELLSKDFVLEVWSTQGSNITSLTSPFSLLTSIPYVRTACIQGAPLEAVLALKCSLFTIIPSALPFVFSDCWHDILADTYYLIDENGNILTDELGNKLIWWPSVNLLGTLLTESGEIITTELDVPILAL